MAQYLVPIQGIDSDAVAIGGCWAELFGFNVGSGEEFEAFLGEDAAFGP